MNRWWEGDGSARLAHDAAIVAATQPGLRHEEQASGLMALAGEVEVRTQSGIPHHIPTRVDFPPDYPGHEPVAIETGNRFPHIPDRHFYSEPDGRCCLWLDVASEWRPRDADALIHFLDQLATFYHRQLILDVEPTAGWAGPEHVHGGGAYVEHLLGRLRMSPTDLRRMVPALAGGVSRNAPCPCRSGKRYRACHLTAVDAFLTRANVQSLSQLLKLLKDPASR